MFSAGSIDTRVLQIPVSSSTSSTATKSTANTNASMKSFSNGKIITPKQPGVGITVSSNPTTTPSNTSYHSYMQQQQHHHNRQSSGAGAAVSRKSYTPPHHSSGAVYLSVIPEKNGTNSKMLILNGQKESIIVNKPVSPVSIPDSMKSSSTASNTATSKSANNLAAAGALSVMTSKLHSSTSEKLQRRNSDVGTAGNIGGLVGDITSSSSAISMSNAMTMNSGRPRRKSSVSSRDGLKFREDYSAPYTKKDKSAEVACKTCGKRYKNHICLQKHAWEHHISWGYTKRLMLNKHQSVQIMEAAHTLMNIMTCSRSPHVAGFAMEDVTTTISCGSGSGVIGDDIDEMSEYNATGSLSPGSDVSF